MPGGHTNIRPIGPGRRLQHADEKLLRAASRVFAREGFAAASVTRIAEAAGATKPTLYARFGSKANLFDATIRYHADAIREQFLAAYDRAAVMHVTDGVREAVDALFAFAAERPDGMTLLFGEHPDAHSSIVKETTEALIQRVAQVVELYAAQGGRSAGGAAPLIAAMTAGCAVSAIRRCLADPSLDPAAVSALTTSFLTAAAQGVDPGLFGLGDEPERSASS